MLASDGVFSTCDLSLGGTGETLFFGAFKAGGVAIADLLPADATVTGFTVRVKRKASALVPDVTYIVDYSVFLAIAETIAGVNFGDGTTQWPTTNTVQTYGGAGNLLGFAGTTAQVRSSDFGMCFACAATGATGCVASGDSVSIEVHYTPAGGVGSSSRLLRGVGV